MAAGAWKVYNKAKKKIANTTINLASGTFRLALVKTMPAATISLLGSATQVTSGNGYSSSGKQLATETWTASGAATYVFDVGDVVFTATGGAINSIKGAVIYLSGASAGACHVLCYSTLTASTAKITLAQGNTLTIQIATTGVFNLS